MIEGAIAVVQDADTVPQLGVLLGMGERGSEQRDTERAREGDERTLGEGKKYKACWYAAYAFCRSSCIR